MANSENTPEFMAETAGDDFAVRTGLMERLGGIVILFAYVEQWLNEFLAHLLEGNSALMHAVTANVRPRRSRIGAAPCSACTTIPTSRPPILWNYSTLSTDCEASGTRSFMACGNSTNRVQP
jgi:hypothetical protein